MTHEETFISELKILIDEFKSLSTALTEFMANEQEPTSEADLIAIFDKFKSVVPNYAQKLAKLYHKFNLLESEFHLQEFDEHLTETYTTIKTNLENQIRIIPNALNHLKELGYE